MRVKDDEVSFLRGHVAQLTQSISQLSLSQGMRRSRKRDGGGSGSDLNWTSI